MTDVSRALLLPDLGSPSGQLLKTLALYWDELVVPDYLERAGLKEALPSVVRQLPESMQALATEGVISLQDRIAELPPVSPDELPARVSGNPSADEASKRMVAIIAPLREMERSKEFGDLSSEEKVLIGKRIIDKAADYAARQYLSRIRDAFELSSARHLAPVSRSPVSHVASIVGESFEAPRTEAALLSTAIQAFEVAADTPVERIIEFRENNVSSIGRFRASLADLSEGLRQDADPTLLLAEARDRYRNRVVPALGELEEVLKEGRIRFFVRSLLGATAITLAPLDPVRAVEGGARILGQTIDYSFSREKIVREHPFGYLHQVSENFGSHQPASATHAFEEVIKDPERQVREIFVKDIRNSPLMSEITENFWFGPSESASENDA